LHTYRGAIDGSLQVIIWFHFQPRFSLWSIPILKDFRQWDDCDWSKEVAFETLPETVKTSLSLLKAPLALA